MQLLKIIKEKLEIDKKERYVDGYYQLTRKQKVWWAIGWFVLVVGFVFVSSFFDRNNSLLAFIIGRTLVVLVFGFTMAIPFMFYSYLVKKSTIFIYQIITICLILTMIGIIFKIDLSAVNIFF
jgi:hypothetical protein